MKYSSSVHQNSRISSDRSTSSEAIRTQSPIFGGIANSVVQLCCGLGCGLVALVLGFASSPMANAASDNLQGPDVRDPAKSDTAKIPKPYPLDFPVVGSGSPDGFQVQQPILYPEAGLAVVLPETAPLSTPNLVTTADGLGITTLEVLGAAQAASPALSTDSTGPEIEFGFSSSDPLAGALAKNSATLSPGEVTPANTSSGPALTAENLLAQTAASADEIPWRFSFEPFFYLPFGANGDITVRGINAPINAGIGDIFDAIVNDLNFAAFGRVEAWKGPWGIFFNGAYMNLGTGRTADIPIPPALQQVGLPPQATLDAAVGTSFVQLDLGGAYRFGDGNLPTALRTADTEFDLGPFVFDALAGVRLYNFNNSLVLTGPLGRQFEFGQSQTVLEPMLGGRARWNLSHNLAALVGANMSGFSIGDLTFSVAGYAGIDWLFSGNTSLLASYGFTYLDYSSGSSGINLFTHGPNIGVKFRF